MINKVGSSCAVDKNIKLAEILNNSLNHCSALFVNGHVGLVYLASYAECLNLGFSLICFLFRMSIVYADVCAFLGKTESDAFTHSGSASCYKGNFSFDIHFTYLLEYLFGFSPY